MFNLLPFEQKKRLKAEYKKRLVVVILLHFFIAELVAVVLLIPTIILTVTDENELSTQMHEFEIQTAETASSSYAALLKQTTDRLGILSPTRNKARPSEAFIHVAEARQAGIHVEKMSYKASKDYAAGDLIIDGHADGRDALLLFRKSLESIENFSSVRLPVSNFAQEKNIPFSINIAVAFTGTTTVLLEQ